MGLPNNLGKLSNTLTSNGTQITLGGSTVTDGNLLNVIGNQSSVNVGLVLNNTNGTYPKIYGLQNVNNNFVLYDYSASATRLTIASTGAATFSSSIALSASSGFPAVGLLNRSSDNNLYMVAASSGFVLLDNSQNTMYNATPTSHTWQISNSPKMTLNSSGNVLIGTTSTAVGGILSLNGDLKFGGTAGGNYNITNYQGGFLAFGTDNTERMRITSNGFTKMTNGGAFLGGTYHEMVTLTGNNYITTFTNTSSNPYGLYIVYPNSSPNSGSTNEFIWCVDSTNSKFIVWSNGTASNRTGTYGTISSDLRLKENITEATSKLDDLMALRVVNFNLTDDTDKKKQIGFIAQEFKEVFPSLVYEKDTREYDEDGNVTKGLEDALGLNVGMEFAILVKAIQELNAKVTALENKA